jgi:hypothetical protein
MKYCHKEISQSMPFWRSYRERERKKCIISKTTGPSGTKINKCGVPTEKNFLCKKPTNRCIFAKVIVSEIKFHIQKRRRIQSRPVKNHFSLRFAQKQSEFDFISDFSTILP